MVAAKLSNVATAKNTIKMRRNMLREYAGRVTGESAKKF
jgi:hypothetical protein